MIPATTTRRGLITAALLAVFLCGAVLSAIHKDITQGFDELAHVSYVAQSQQDGVPNLTRLHLLDPHSFQFTAKPSYLNHPFPYYWFLGAIGPRLEGHPGAVLFFRLINVLLAAIGLAACLTMGSEDRLKFYAYAVPLLCIPFLVALAGAVNNDNAAFCGGAVACAALYRLVQDHRTRWLLLALLGVVIASWAKLTGLLLAGTVTAAVVAWLVWQRRSPPSWVAATAVGLVIAPAPYIAFVIIYGSPAPDTPAQHAMLVSGAVAAGWAGQPRLSFPHYVAFFVAQFFSQWAPVLTPRSGVQLAMLAIPVLTVAAAAVGTVLAAKRVVARQAQAVDVLLVACAVAFALTFAAHIGFSYQRHLATGWLMDAYPRYYLPIAPFVPLAALSAAGALAGRWRQAALVLLIISPLIFRFFAAPL